MWDKNFLNHLLQLGIVCMRDYFKAFISRIVAISH